MTTVHPKQMLELPSGIPVATYGSYAEAQRAIDYLSDERFPVENTTIVGRNLRQIEKITGRMSWLRALGAGLATGAWFGALVGLLLGLFAVDGWAWLATILTGLVFGGLFGLIFGAVGYAQLAGRRDFTSHTAVIAEKYDVLCAPDHADGARDRLARLALTGQVVPDTPPAPRSGREPSVDRQPPP